ncbi:MAG: hypothetical protein JXR70_18050 [Spirochaetales bacterium]|nr:hypothetical protein [Spirochaetales bacterium]
MNANIIIDLNQIQLLIILILVFILAVLIVIVINRIVVAMKLAGVRRRGRKGEMLAKKHLLKMGYTIIDQQISLTCAMMIDQESRKFQLRADFLVSKNNLLGVVEVKSGQDVSRPWHIDTRRQLLEYFHYYRADFLLLYNSAQDKLQEIYFPAAVR